MKTSPQKLTLAAASLLISALGCSSSSSAGDSNADLFGGTWSCNLVDADEGVTNYNDAQLTTTVEDGGLAVWGPGGLSQWMTCGIFQISGDTASQSNFQCGYPYTFAVTSGAFTVSSDGNTLTVDEVGVDSGSTAILTGTCTKTGPAPSPSSSSSSGSSSGSTSTPECTNDSECGGCAMCQYGQCWVCPIGTQGICTC